MYLIYKVKSVSQLKHVNLSSDIESSWVSGFQTQPQSCKFFFNALQIMITRQRIDLNMNIPALRKLDAMLIVRECSTIRKLYKYTHIYV